MYGRHFLCRRQLNGLIFHISLPKQKEANSGVAQTIDFEKKGTSLDTVDILFLFCM
jgi:hypothetical protein